MITKESATQRMPDKSATGAPIPRMVYSLSVVTAVLSILTGSLTFFLPDVLQGPAVTNGNARGTALVMVGLATPLLLASMWRAIAGSWRATFTWMGSLFYLAYNTFLLLFLTPFNSLFLLYVATASVVIFSIVALFSGTDRRWVVHQMRKPPIRGLAIFIWTIVALNAVAWLQVVVPAVLSEDPTSFLDGLGVATNAIYVQDLVFWLPLMSVAAWWMWNGRAKGIVLTGSWLVFGAIESIGIAVDQWFGHQADPLSPHASTAVIPIMIGLAIANVSGIYFYLRRGVGGVRQPRERDSSN